jgi:hypothetical protein
MIPTWLVLVTLYIVWNLCAYLDRTLLKDRMLVDIVYWLNERVFVIVVWLFIYQQLKGSVWKRYAWIAKTFIWVATAKLIYLGLILIKWIKPNDGWALMGIGFIIVIGYILTKWERSQQKS